MSGELIYIFTVDDSSDPKDRVKISSRGFTDMKMFLVRAAREHLIQEYQNKYGPTREFDDNTVWRSLRRGISDRDAFEQRFLASMIRRFEQFSANPTIDTDPYTGDKETSYVRIPGLIGVYEFIRIDNYTSPGQCYDIAIAIQKYYPDLEAIGTPAKIMDNFNQLIDLFNVAVTRQEYVALSI